ncbi:MAG: DUF3341 domain-containing protein [Chloroflexi bacterium]|nr:DUF3341 domain-containing protein [Chloroflexota bacterium]
MPMRHILGLFKEVERAAEGVSALEKAGFAVRDSDILTGTPYPEGTFGEPPPRHRLYFFPLVGAVCGFSVALLLTAGTQLAYPLVTGGKPILSIPPMTIITYEGTMLGAILFTVLGIIFESRLPGLSSKPYDVRITEGYIGIMVSCQEERAPAAEQALRQAGAEDVKQK